MGRELGKVMGTVSSKGNFKAQAAFKVEIKNAAQGQISGYLALAGGRTVTVDVLTLSDESGRSMDLSALKNNPKNADSLNQIAASIYILFQEEIEAAFQEAQGDVSQTQTKNKISKAEGDIASGRVTSAKYLGKNAEARARYAGDAEAVAAAMQEIYQLVMHATESALAPTPLTARSAADQTGDPLAQLPSRIGNAISNVGEQQTLAREMDALRAELRKKEEECANLRENLFQKDQTIQLQAGKLRDLERVTYERDRLEQSYESAQRRLEEANRKIFQLENENTALRQQLTLAESAARELRGVNDGLRREIEDLKNHLEEGQKNLGRSQQTVEELTQQLQSVRRELASRIQKGDADSTLISELNVQIQNLSAQREAAVQELQEARAEHNRVKTELTEQLSEARSELSRVQAQHSQALSVIQHLHQENTSLRWEIQRKEGVIQDKSARIGEMGRQISFQRQTIQNLTRRLQEKEALLQRQETGSQALRDEVASLRSQLSRVTNSLALNQVELTTLRNDLQVALEGKAVTEQRLDRAQSTIQELREALEETITNASRAQAKASGLEAQLESAVNARRQLETELTGLRSELEQLTGKIGSQEEDIVAKEATIGDLQENIRELQRQLKEQEDRYSQQVDSLSTESKEQLEQLRNTKSQLEDLLSRLGTLRPLYESSQARCNDLERQLEQANQREEEQVQKAVILERALKDLSLEKDRLSQSLGEAQTQLSAAKREFAETQKALENTLSEKDQVISTKDRLISAAESQVQSLEAQLEEARREIAQASSQLREQQAKLDAKDRDIEQLEGKLQELTRLNEHLRSEIEAIDQKFQESRKANTVLQEQIQNLNNANTSLKSELRITNAGIQELRDQLASTNSGLESARVEVEELTQALSKATAGKDQISQQLIAAQKKLQQEEVKVADLQQKLEGMESDRRTLSDQLRQQEREQVRLSSELRKNEKDIEKLTEKFDAKQAELERVQHEKERQLAQIQELTQSLSDERERAKLEVARLQESVNGQKSEIATLHGRLQNVTNDLEGEKAKNAALQAEIESLDTRFNELQGDKASSAAERDRLKGMLEQARQAQVFSNQRISQLTEEIQSVRNESQQALQKARDDYDRSLQALGQTNSQQIRELSKSYEERLKQQLDTFQAEIKILSGHLTASHSENRELRANLDNAESKIKLLQAQLDEKSEQISTSTQQRDQLQSELENARLQLREASNALISKDSEHGRTLGELENLRAQLVGASQRVEELNRSLQAAESQIAQLEQEKVDLGREAEESLQEVRHQLAQSSADYTSQISSLESQLADGLMRMQELSSHLEEAQRNLGKEKAARADDNATIETQQREINLLKQNLEVSSLRLSQLESELLAKSQELESAQQENSRLSKDIASLNSAIAEQKSLAQQKNAAQDEMLRRLAATESARDALTLQKQVLEKRIDDLSGELTQLRKETAREIQDLQAAHDKAISQIREQAEEAKARLNREHLDKIAQMQSSWEEERSQLQAQVNRGNMYVADLEAQLSRSRSQLSIQQQEIQELKRKQEENSEKLHLAQQELQQFKEAAIDKELQDEQARHREADLKEQVARLQAQRDEISSRLAEVESRASKLEREKQGLEERFHSESNDLRREVAQLKAALEAEKAQVKALQDKVKDFDALVAQLQDAEQETSILRNETARLRNAVTESTAEREKQELALQELQGRLAAMVAKNERLKKEVEEKGKQIQAATTILQDSKASSLPFANLADGIGNLIDNLQALKSELNIKDNQLSQALRDNEHLQQELSQSKDAESALRAQLTTNSEIIQALQRELERNKELQTTLQSKVDHLEGERNAIQGRYAAILEKLNSIQETNAIQRQQDQEAISKAQEQLSAIKIELSSVAQERQRLQSALADSQAAMEVISKKNQQIELLLQDQTASFAEKCAAWENAISEEQGRNASLQEEIEGLRASVNELEPLKVALQTEKNRASQLQIELEEHTAAAQDSKEAHTQELTRLRNELDAAMQNSLILQDRLGKKEGEIKDAVETINRLLATRGVQEQSILLDASEDVQPLGKKLEVLQKIIIEREGELQRAASENQQLREEVAKLADKNIAYQKEIDDKAVLIVNLKEELGQTKELLARTQLLTRDLEAQKAQHTEQIQSLQSRLDDLTIQSLKNKDEIANYVGEIKELKDQISEHIRQRSQISEQLTQAGALQQRLKDEKERSEQELQGLKRSLDQLQGELLQERANNGRLQNVIDELQVKISLLESLQGQLIEAQRSVQELAEQISQKEAAAESQQAQWQRQLAAKQEQYEQLQREFDQQKSQITAAAELLSNNLPSSVAVDLGKGIGELKQMVQVLRDELATKEIKLNEESEKNEALQRDLASLTQRNIDLQRDVTDSQSRMQSLEADLAGLKRSLESSESNVKILEAQAQDNTKQIFDLRNALRQLEAEKLAQQVRDAGSIKQLEGEIEGIRKQLDEKIRYHEELSQSLQQSRTDLATLKKEKADLELAFQVEREELKDNLSQQLLLLKQEQGRVQELQTQVAELESLRASLSYEKENVLQLQQERDRLIRANEALALEHAQELSNLEGKIAEANLQIKALNKELGKKELEIESTAKLIQPILKELELDLSPLGLTQDVQHVVEELRGRLELRERALQKSLLDNSRLQDELATLRERNSQLQTQVADNLAHTQTFKKRVEELQGLLEIAQSQRQIIEEEKNTNALKITSLEAQLRELAQITASQRQEDQEAIASKQQQVADLQRQLEELKSERKILLENLSQSGELVAALRKENETAQSEFIRQNSDLRAQLQSLNDSLQAERGQVLRLQQQVGDFERLCLDSRALEQEIDQLRQRTQEQEDAKQASAKELLSLRQELTNKEEDRQRLQTIVDEQAAKIEAAVQGLGISESISPDSLITGISSLRGQLQILESLKEQLRIKDTEIQNALDENERLRAEVITLRQEKDSLQAQVKDSLSRIQNLESELQHMKSELLNRQSEVGALKLEKQTNTTLIQRLQEELDRLKAESDSLNQSNESVIAGLKSALEDAEKRDQRLSTDLAKAQSQISSLDQAKHQLELKLGEENTTLRAQISQLDASLEDAQQKNRELQERMESLQSQVGQLEPLQVELATERTRLMQLQETISKLTADSKELERLQGEMTQKSAAIERLEVALHQKETDIQATIGFLNNLLHEVGVEQKIPADLESTRQSLEQQFMGLLATLKANGEELQRAKSTNEELNTRLASQEASHKDLHAQLDTLTRENAELQSVISRHAQKLKEQSSRIEYLTQELEKAMSRVADLESKSVRLQTQVQELSLQKDLSEAGARQRDEQITVLQERIRKINSEKTQALSDVQALTQLKQASDSELQKIRTEQAELKGKYEKLLAKNRLLESDCVALRQQLADATNKNNILSQRIQEKEQTILNLEKEVRVARHRLHSLGSTKEGLEAQLRAKERELNDVHLLLAQQIESSAATDKKLEKVDALKKGLEAEIAKLVEQKAKVDADLQQLQRDMQVQQRELQEQRDSNETLVQEKASLANKVRLLTFKMAKIEESLGLKDQTNKDVNTRIHEIVEENLQLRRQLVEELQRLEGRSKIVELQVNLAKPIKRATLVQELEAMRAQTTILNRAFQPEVLPKIVQAGTLEALCVLNEQDIGLCIDQLGLALESPNADANRDIILNLMLIVANYRERIPAAATVLEAARIQFSKWAVRDGIHRLPRGQQILAAMSNRPGEACNSWLVNIEVQRVLQRFVAGDSQYNLLNIGKLINEELPIGNGIQNAIKEKLKEELNRIGTFLKEPFVQVTYKTRTSSLTYNDLINNRLSEILDQHGFYNYNKADFETLIVGEAISRLNQKIHECLGPILADPNIIAQSLISHPVPVNISKKAESEISVQMRGLHVLNEQIVNISNQERLNSLSSEERREAILETRSKYRQIVAGHIERLLTTLGYPLFTSVGATDSDTCGVVELINYVRQNGSFPLALQNMIYGREDQASLLLAQLIYLHMACSPLMRPQFPDIASVEQLSWMHNHLENTDSKAEVILDLIRTIAHDSALTPSVTPDEREMGMDLSPYSFAITPEQASWGENVQLLLKGGKPRDIHAEGGAGKTTMVKFFIKQLKRSQQKGMEKKVLFLSPFALPPADNSEFMLTGMIKKVSGPTEYRLPVGYNADEFVVIVDEAHLLQPDFRLQIRDAEGRVCEASTILKMTATPITAGFDLR